MTATHPDDFNQRLMAFLAAAPTAFHAARVMASTLEEAGFTRIYEADAWQLIPGERYYLLRNDSSIIGFIYGKETLPDSGIRMLGAHTDSPCLKIKPKADVFSQGYQQLAVEVYGGVLLSTWFDRDLSVAGRVTYRDSNNVLRSLLIDFKNPIATVPSLAIHLDREANRNHSINAQDDIKPVLMLGDKSSDSWQVLLQQQVRATYPDADVAEILDSELCLYDTQKPALTGFKQEFIASSRLDNLLSCFVGLEALCQADNNASCLLICTDHEEVGSASACGAKGPMLAQFLERLLPDNETRLRALDNSFMISADNAHGVHPNFAAKHDAGHGPLLNAGPVIKVNANQRYATNSESSALFRLLCQQADVPVQSFVSRSDMECGSTIGPITASEVGVKTLDVGVPTFAMHSIRELAGCSDAWYLHQVINAFFARLQAPGKFG
ncbi:MAG TPA: M18 family aminopeptidase [Cellvibrionaceae bacterium]